MEKVDVIFRTEKDGSTLAVFPYMIADSLGNCTCYSHIGQHSAMSWNYIYDTKVCNDYEELLIELENIGYNLNIIKRRNYKKYIQAYKELRLTNK